MSFYHYTFQNLKEIGFDFLLHVVFMQFVILNAMYNGPSIVCCAVLYAARHVVSVNRIFVVRVP